MATVIVTMGPWLPFSPPQLDQALSLRITGPRRVLPSTPAATGDALLAEDPVPARSPAPALLLRVQRLGEDHVIVRWAHIQRIIPLLGYAGPAAARRVALAIADLIQDPLVVTPPPRPALPTITEPPQRPARASQAPSKRAAVISAVAGLLLGLPASSASAPPGPSATPTQQEIQELLGEVNRFKAAARSYQQTVDHLVRQSYQRRRHTLIADTQRTIRTEEMAERVQRLATITLFEDFLRRYPRDQHWTPDVIFRLAELYFEKANDEYLLAMEQYEQALNASQAAPATRPPPASPQPDYRRTVSWYQHLMRTFPEYRLLDAAIYLHGFCVSEMGDPARGIQSYLALVCHQRSPSVPTSEAQVKTSAGSTSGTPSLPAAPATPVPSAKNLPSRFPPALDSLTPTSPMLRLADTIAAYDTCRPLSPQSRFNAEAWMRIAEYHFDENQLGQAIAAYGRVLSYGPQQSSLYASALYKLAWTYFRADHFAEAIEHFDRLVTFSDEEERRSGRSGSEMRPEAIQYLGISFTEEEWDGDTNSDPRRGLARLESFYGQRPQEKHVVEVYQRTADIYFDRIRYEEAIPIYQRILSQWPLRPDNPEAQRHIILAWQRLGQPERAQQEQERFSRLFGAHSAWMKQQAENASARRQAQELEHEYVLQAAIQHHNLAKSLRDQAVTTKQGALAEAARREYALAATAYQHLLQRFPARRRRDEFQQALAFCLFYATRYPEAAEQFRQLRDHHPDPGQRAEAAISVIKVFEAQIDEEVQRKALRVPPLPDPARPPHTMTAQPLPTLIKRWQAALDVFTKRWPRHPRAPRLAYKAAEIALRWLDFPQARARLESIYQQHCAKPIALTAAQAILTTYQMQGQLEQTAAWNQKLKSGQCGGKSPATEQAMAKAEALDAAIRFARAEKRLNAKQWAAAAAAFVALAESTPPREIAAKALNNAAVSYEKLQRSGQAADLYERLWQQYSDQPLADQALFRAALNYQRAFQFSRALSKYRLLAESPRFEHSAFRQRSLYNAALLLENEQAYGQAAHLFARYAALEKDLQQGAAAAFRAAQVYAKGTDPAVTERAFLQFIRRYGHLPGQDDRVIEALVQVADLNARRGRWAAADPYYRRAISEWQARGLTPAGEAAEHAARAAWQRAEHALQHFLRRTLNGPLPTLSQRKAQLVKTATTLAAEYEQIWSYKRAAWTLAALYRQGTILEHVARALDEGIRQAPLPQQVRRLGQDAVALYLTEREKLLVQEVDPLVEAAKQKYQLCLERGQQLQITTKHTATARQKLHTFDPQKWPLLKPAKVELLLE